MNFSSPNQLSTVLYDKLKLDVLETTDGNKPSTGKWALKKLARKYPEHMPFFDNLKRYRTLRKYKDTYCTNWIEKADKDNRLHAPINIIGAESGRISSPFMQIPKRTDDASKVRRAIIARPGCKLVSGDMSQIEARIRAHISQDPELLRIFRAGEDVYKHTASAALNMDVNLVTTKERDIGKVIDLAISYGETKWGLKDELNCSEEEAEAFLQRYFKRFPVFAIWQREQILRVKKRGYTETIFGLKRKISSDINLPMWGVDERTGRYKAVNRAKIAAAERQALNLGTQGSVAQIMDMAAVNIQKRLSTETRMILQVHDDLLFEIPEERVERAVPFIKNTMENVIKLSVPTPCKISIGTNLAEMTEVK